MDFPMTSTQRLFDGVVLHMDWGDRKVLNLHLSGEIIRNMEKQGCSEELLTKQVKDFLLSLLSPMSVL